MQKRAGGGPFFVFRRRLAYSTSLATLDDISPTPPPSHAQASWWWFSFRILMPPHLHHLPRTQKSSCIDRGSRKMGHHRSFLDMADTPPVASVQSQWIPWFLK
ncbi:hypothetical protein K443DRAFT_12906 [Laccaria amethystina LaAM-08-1]|uniref:Uncharacterized protein n=1 Tax=Laccaria amethystina LaAM-08-1 TaxID=1095629 RepID=A0A0C9WQE5_9AGAR|nr:hypothetical protein K443DRAFT_12906 [Laccaria amethystina LaAM-08-1]